jgi:hypothetical protein
LKVEKQEKDLHRGRGGRRVHREAKRREEKKRQEEDGTCPRKTVRAWRGIQQKNWGVVERKDEGGSVCIRLTVLDLLVTFQQARYFSRKKIVEEAGRSRYGIRC